MDIGQHIHQPSEHQHECMINYQHFPSGSSYDIASTETSLDDVSSRNVLGTHRSMWVMNPVYSSSRGACNPDHSPFVLKKCIISSSKITFIFGFANWKAVSSDMETKYKTQSLPNWVKMKKSLTYAHMGYAANDARSQNRRSRMRNDGAAIIAMSRSRSQNLAQIQCEREGVIIYNERTHLWPH